MFVGLVCLLVYVCCYTCLWLVGELRLVVLVWLLVSVCLDLILLVRMWVGWIVGYCAVCDVALLGWFGCYSLLRVFPWFPKICFELFISCVDWFVLCCCFVRLLLAWFTVVLWFCVYGAVYLLVYVWFVNCLFAAFVVCLICGLICVLCLRCFPCCFVILFVLVQLVFNSVVLWYSLFFDFVICKFVLVMFMVCFV